MELWVSHNPVNTKYDPKWSRLVTEQSLTGLKHSRTNTGITVYNKTQVANFALTKKKHAYMIFEHSIACV